MTGLAIDRTSTSVIAMQDCVPPIFAKSNILFGPRHALTASLAACGPLPNLRPQLPPPWTAATTPKEIGGSKRIVTTGRLWVSASRTPGGWATSVPNHAIPAASKPIALQHARQARRSSLARRAVKKLSMIAFVPCTLGPVTSVDTPAPGALGASNARRLPPPPPPYQ